MMVLASAFRDGPKSKFYCRRKEKVRTGRTRARRDDSMLPHDADARNIVGLVNFSPMKWVFGHRAYRRRVRAGMRP
jgi:hypothetical protein